jgi:carbamoyltransferase
MRILGLSAFYHDSAAALVVDGHVVAAAQEERFTRKKHDEGYPHHAIEFCLKQGRVKPAELDAVVFYDKPFIKFDRLIETYLATAPKGYLSFAKAMPLWLKEKLFQKNILLRRLKECDPTLPWQDKLLFSEHHLSHAASAYYPSPFQDAVVLTMDGVGEWTTTSVCIGRSATLEVDRELHFPHSLGLLYSAFTYYTGFKVNSGEYKVMGLAPYGSPRFAKIILDQVLDLKEDGSFRLNMKYFDFHVGLKMTNDHFSKLFSTPVRRPDEKLSQVHMDIAASIQAVTEEVVLRLTRSLAKEGISENLCLAGGVALNCVANGKVQKDGAFKRVWVQPASGDAGGALGAALAAYHMHYNKPRVAKDSDGMAGSYLGPEFEQNDIEARLKAVGAQFEVLDEPALMDTVAQDLANGLAIGWFQGRMEYGPRALGGRSILGDARSPKMQSVLNLKVKYRESFRPFAPAVLKEDLQEWFDFDDESPYMLMVAGVKPDKRIAMTAEQEKLFGIDKLNVPRSKIPAVTHVDYSARIQTVDAKTNPRFHTVLKRFKDKTGCPVLVNTSFNVRGEPIVCTPEDAFRCFMGTEIERLAVGNCYLKKENQDPKLKLDYKDRFELD